MPIPRSSSTREIPDGGAKRRCAIGAVAAPLDALPGSSSDVLIQATPLGCRGEEVDPERSLRRRLVVDLAYGPAETPLIVGARRRGLEAVDGVRFLAEQAVGQFERMTGVRIPATTMEAAARGWLRTRA